MPEVLLKLLQLCQNEASNFAQLTELIAQDAACSAKVIAAANAVGRQPASPITRLDQCLLRLGKDAIKTLVIGESVFQVFHSFAGHRAGDLRRFWCHTLTTAVLAKELADTVGYPHGEEAYLAGLLHDVGRLGLLAATPERYATLLLHDDTDALCALEQQVLQTTHAAVGAWLIGQWRMGGFIADSVRYHHEDPAALRDAHPLIRITHVANRLARVLYQQTMDREQVRLAEEVAEQLCGIDVPRCRSLGSAARSQVVKMASRLGIDVGAISLNLEQDPDATQLLPVWRDEAATQRALTDAVQQMVLCQLVRLQGATVGDALAQGEAGLLRQFARTLHILFGLSCPVAFLREPGQHLARGLPLNEDLAHLAELTLPLPPSDCLATRALQADRVIEIDAGRAQQLLDRQMLANLGAERLLCVPMRVQGDVLGLLVLRGDGAELAVPSPLLLALAGQAASELLQLRERQEAARIEAQQMQAAYRQQGRAMVHEVNNPLSIIKNYLGILAGQLTDAERVPAGDMGRELQIIREEIQRVGNILARMGEPPLGSVSSAAWFDMAGLVEEVAAFFEELVLAVPGAASGVRLSSRVEAQLPAVRGDRQAAKQVLLNLVKNALEALAGRAGQVSLDATGLVHRDGDVFVELQIRDDGPGMPPTLLGQLFRPIKSSKGNGHQGLGLTIVKELMDGLGGHITCRSGRYGTEFSLLLPAQQQGGAATLAVVANDQAVH
ncbi:HDOD domain-containing protein [Chitinimonas sp.]|uniref:HDOD domain-containing protein n=1 Tax=Chitinimonas sp. TaxID=1934313 RepID=UPI002F91C221